MPYSTCSDRHRPGPKSSSTTDICVSILTPAGASASGICNRHGAIIQ